MTVRSHVMTITPFGPDEQLDEAALRSHLQTLAAAGIGVFLGSYGTGEGRILRRDEIRRLYRVGVEELAGRVPFAAAALGLDATEHVIERALEAHELGVETVQIHPPLAGPPSIAPLPRERDRFYADVLGSVTGPVVVSNEVLMVGYSLEPEWMRELIDSYPQIVGINWTDSDPGSLGRLMALVGDRVPVRVGLTAQLPAALALGGEGSVSFEPNVAPELCRSLTDAFAAGDTQAFHERFGQLMQLNAVLARNMTPRSVKAALEHLGRAGTTLRRPYLGLAADAREEIAAILEQLGIRAAGGVPTESR
jgi:4-hydroxy-tetrahydrodipicolinate synthase